MCNQKSFDELAELFQVNPAGHNKYRQEQIKQKISDLCANCPEHEAQCRRFQWRIEQELAKHKNPIDKYNKMVELFWDGVQKFEKITITDETPTQTAAILQFDKRS